VDASGRQITITHGDLVAVVTEVGAGLRLLRHAGEDLIDGYEAGAVCEAGRGQVLIPWPNRVADGRYRWEGRDLQLALDEVPTGCALHGLTRWLNWRVAEERPDAAVLELRLHPRPGYPFLLDLRVEHRVGADGYRVRTTARNGGDAPAPYGTGAHPYLRLGAARVDDLEVRMPAATVLTADERGIPTGRAPVTGDTDLRAGRRLGDTVLDTAFTDLDRDADGRAWVHVRATGGGAAAVWMDPAHTHVMLFTGDTEPTVARRSLGVEPMTCAPNALASGDGVRRLAPGESVTTEWGIRPGP